MIQTNIRLLKKIKFLLPLSLLFLIAAPVGCSHRSTSSEALAQAIEAYEAADYRSAQKICDSLAVDSRLATLDATRLCDLSLLLLHLSETAGNEDENIALAARSLQKARNLAPDSVEMFFSTLPVEDRARLVMLAAITEGHNTPVPADTVYYEEQ